MRQLRIFVLVGLMVVGGVGYCQGDPAIGKEDVSKIAREYVLSLDPPEDLSSKHEVDAVYIKKENVWIVSFADNRPIPPPDSDFMIKIDATSGKPLGIIGGAGKQEYYIYFEKKH